MKRYSLVIIVFFVLVLFASHLKVQGEEDQAKRMQEKRQKAMQELKREIKANVKVANPGSISGKIQCRSVRHSGDTVVYIEKVGGNDYDPPQERGIMDQINLAFIPHVLAIQRGTTVDFPNSDLVRHNVFSPPDSPSPFNLGTYDSGASKSFTFDDSGVVPILCNVHADMSGYIAVLDNPYFAVTKRDGTFTIDNVPVGTYKLMTWHEKLRTEEQKVRVEGGKSAEVSFMLNKRK